MSSNTDFNTEDILNENAEAVLEENFEKTEEREFELPSGNYNISITADEGATGNMTIKTK